MRIPSLLIFIFFFSCEEKSKDNKGNLNMAGVKFWTDNQQIFCGNQLITLKIWNDKLEYNSTITGVFFSQPDNCLSTPYGGYIYAETGTYNYNIVGNNCQNINGSITVNSGCNRVKI